MKGKPLNINTNKTRFWCEIALTVLTLILAVLFITQVADIYYSGGDGDIYTRAKVWAKLKKLILPISLWLIMIIVCFTLSVLCKDGKKGTQKIDSAGVLKRISKRIFYVEGKGIDGEYSAYRKRETVRYALYITAGVVSVFTAVWAIIYLANSNNFKSGVINTDVLKLVKMVFPFILLSFVLFTLSAVYEICTAKRQLERAKSILVATKGVKAEDKPANNAIETVYESLEKHSKGIILGARIVVGVLAVVFIGLGLSNGGEKDVLYKAVNICTECIGLG